MWVCGATTTLKKRTLGFHHQSLILTAQVCKSMWLEQRIYLKTSGEDLLMIFNIQLLLPSKDPKSPRQDRFREMIKKLYLRNVLAGWHWNLKNNLNVNSHFGMVYLLNRETRVLWLINSHFNYSNILTWMIKYCMCYICQINITTLVYCIKSVVHSWWSFLSFSSSELRQQSEQKPMERLSSDISKVVIP